MTAPSVGSGGAVDPRSDAPCVSGPSDPYAVRTFEEFWPHYVRLHRRPATHALHALATLSCLSLLGSAVLFRQPLFALAAPLADFVIAQASHRLFEKNRTTPWKNQLWHTRAELRMLGLVLSLRMAREVARVGGGEAAA